jgi:CubicO group peptidase (beta-lactamase class C family)
VSLGWAASLEVAIELVADGTLDPDATIDAWLPASPNADRITVQMLIDGTHGWGGFAASPVDLQVEHIVSDPARSWSLDEVLETYEVIPPASDPGQFDPDARPTGLTALAYIAQQVTGRPYADLVAEHLAVPAGLDGTFLTDGADLPDGFQHGRFDLGGTRDTSAAPVTALATYEPVDWALVSTVPDLLDMIDTWVDGTWRPGGSPATPSMFPDERADDTTGQEQIIGLGVPYHGYCPCTATGDGNEVTSIGRRPYRVGTELHTVHYLEDGVSVVVLFNSDAWQDRSQIIAVVDQIHAAVGTST